MTETRTARARANRRSGLAGLLVALFVVAGLVAGYGLGHAPPMRICTEHAVSAPVAAAAAAPGGSSGGASAVPGDASGAAPGPASGLGSDAVSGPAPGVLGGPVAVAHAAPTPSDMPGPSPGDVCLCLAVLLTLMALVLAGAARRPFLRLPARSGRVPNRPPGAALAAPSLSALQVLRL
ncbi:hypothetical protein [Actinomadura sp. WAC 06369]|uniref:hypothetical protein n=1 Tax=Actinomadura sp. WAC 06369 TaxID=2203193 RepID=UPI000F7B6A34|nr:hypothetical protein [Actinomadura sp. WAC 06369]RSN64552.1 hypothetical protein DMH08_17380 [Actinomadura sp. WAC 06369]